MLRLRPRLELGNAAHATHGAALTALAAHSAVLTASPNPSHVHRMHG